MLRNSHVRNDLTGAAICASYIAWKALALIGRHTVSVATVGYAHGLAAQGIGLTQTSRVALGAHAFARLTADFIVSAGDIALWLTEESRAVQLVTFVAATSAIQKALTMRTTQRAGGHTIVTIVEHEIIKALTLSAWQTEAILLASIAAVWHTS